ncbi:MAG: carboxylate--amine ligase, partial [Simkaniaceae bacterium]|nr:carboxylate--amine ligase [Simkaniaceae bacterium]
CGVDMVITSPKKTQADSSYAIIELNFNPVLFIHAYPYKGEKRDVATPILSLLGYSKYA